MGIYKLITNWLKNKAAAFLIATSKIEKDAFTQRTTNDLDTNMISEKGTGTLLHGLKKNILNQEVKNLRWRTYKILKASKDLALTFDKNDADGDAWYKTRKVEQSRLLNKVILDEHDNYPLEMVVTNEEIKLANLEAISEHLKVYDEPVKNQNEKGEVESATHGEIAANEFFINNKGEKQIQIVRDNFPRFYLERYTKKMNIRVINETDRLLEFYVSKYPNEYDRTNYLFIKEINKLIQNGPERINFLDIQNVEFISENTLGSEDFLYYNYKVKSFDKVVEFDGHYVIKFVVEVLTNGDNVLSKYVEPELEQKYLNKERKT